MRDITFSSIMLGSYWAHDGDQCQIGFQPPSIWIFFCNQTSNCSYDADAYIVEEDHS